MSNAPDNFPKDYKVIEPNDPFEVTAGPYFIPEIPDDDPRIVMLAEARHCNRLGVIHGGNLMTMADLWLCDVAVNDFRGQEVMVTISMNFEFVSKCEIGDFVVARGEVVRRTNSLVFVRGQVAAGAKILLNASGVLKRVKLKAPKA
jgi:uncharacterized protein (TIGR00369 family)